MSQAIRSGTVIADSEATLVVEGYHDFAADSGRWELLKENDRQTVCRWKGADNYCDTGGRIHRAAVWQYRDSSTAANIMGPVAKGGGIEMKRTSAQSCDVAISAMGLRRRLLPGGQSR
jgi:uncharacterized protein (DUF427 family)